VNAAAKRQLLNAFIVSSLEINSALRVIKATMRTLLGG